MAAASAAGTARGFWRAGDCAECSPDQPGMTRGIRASSSPSVTTSANSPATLERISKREKSLRFVLPAPMSSTDWLWPSARGDTSVPSGRRSATFSPVNAKPAGEVADERRVVVDHDGLPDRGELLRPVGQVPALEPAGQA